MVTNEEMMKQLEITKNEMKKATYTALAAIGFAIFAVAIPTFIELMGLIDEGKWIFIFAYFGIGLFLILDSVNKISKLKKIMQ